METYKLNQMETYKLNPMEAYQLNQMEENAKKNTKTILSIGIVLSVVLLQALSINAIKNNASLKGLASMAVYSPATLKDVPSDIIPSSTPTMPVADTLSVRDFGAKPGDGLDDTKAIQSAIDAAIKGTIKIVKFPAGQYDVSQVYLGHGLTLLGYGATLKMLPMQDASNRIFSTVSIAYKYSGDVDSKPLIIKGFVFDGNRQAQGAYKNWELEHQALIFLDAGLKKRGRLVSTIEDVTVRDCVGDGIGVSGNNRATIKNVIAENDYRGGITIGGAGNIVNIDRFTARGNDERTGLHVEQNTETYLIGNTITLKNSFIQKHLQLSLLYGSTFTADNITVGSTWLIQTLDSSSATIKNSSFGSIGLPQTKNNLVFPRNITFDNVDFYAPRLLAAPLRHNPHAAVTILMNNSTNAFKNQTLRFLNCRFHPPKSGMQTWPLYGVRINGDILSLNNKIIIQNMSVNSRFTARFYRPQNTTIIEKDLMVKNGW